MSLIDVNKIIIISGPSGAGEDSIIDGLSKLTKINRVITTTTRAMRYGESEGNPYYFISKNEFLNKIKTGEMLEWAKQYNDNYYGVTLEEIKRVTSLDGLAIWKIEYQGVINMKKKFPGLKAVFITVESLDILERRIRKRGNITEEYIKERIEYTKEWMKHTDIYDFTIVNKEGKLQEAVNDLYSLLKDNGYIK